MFSNKHKPMKRIQLLRNFVNKCQSADVPEAEVEQKTTNVRNEDTTEMQVQSVIETSTSPVPYLSDSIQEELSHIIDEACEDGDSGLSPIFNSDSQHILESNETVFIENPSNSSNSAFIEKPSSSNNVFIENLSSLNSAFNENPSTSNNVFIENLSSLNSAFNENPSTSNTAFNYTTEEEPVDDSDEDENYVTESSNNSSSEDESSISKIKCQRKKRNKSTSDGSQEGVNKKHCASNSKKMEIGTKNINKRCIKGETREVRQKRRELRNLGKEYVTGKEKVVRERKCRDLRKCRLKCNEKLDDETRLKLFSEYWSMGNYNKRVSYISSLVSTMETKVTRRKSANKKHKKRSVSHIYYMRINGDLVKVCKECFLRTFDETNKFLTNVLKNKLSSLSGITADDKRGKGTSSNKIPTASQELVKSHIMALPCYESHYCRKQTKNKFLPSHYTLHRVYEEYKKWIPQNETPVSRRIYETQLHDMNIKIKSPKKDSCAKCDRMTMTIKNSSDTELKETIKTNLEQHQADAELAYESKRMDKAEALINTSKSVYTFDLQQCLPTPDIQTSVAFYKRQLWTYNLTIHRCEDKRVFCYMWDETEAGRGANQIASCLYKHFENLDPRTNKITLYSDTCAGQNKNSYLPIMFMLVLKQHPSLEYIEHKFLEAGHTHMECDTDHSIIEKKKKKYESPVEHPRDWMQLVRMCGTKKPFEVIEMKRQNFYEFSALFKSHFQQKKINDEGEKLSWKDIKWLRYSSQQCGIFEYKTSLKNDEPFKKIDYRRKAKTLPSKVINVPLSYKGPVPINPLKKANLLELLPYVNNNFHLFYKNLLTKADLPNILPLTDEDEEDSAPE